MKPENPIPIEHSDSNADLDLLKEFNQPPSASAPPDLFYDRAKPGGGKAPLRQAFAFAVIFALLGILLLVPFSFSVAGAARVEPARELVVESLVNGELTTLYAREGEKLKAGQPIALIYDRTNDQEVVNAEASLKMAIQEIEKLQTSAKFAQKESRTNETLYVKDAITNHEKEKSDFEYQSILQEIAIEQTKRDNLITKINYLKKMKQIGLVRAPMDGIILTKVSHRLYSYFMKGDEILRIADLSKAYLGMPVNEHQLWRIREGDRAKIKFYAYPDKVFSGRVSSIRYSAYEKSEKVGSTENVIDVMIEVDGKLPFSVRPGAMAKVSVEGHAESVFRKLKNSLWM